MVHDYETKVGPYKVHTSMLDTHDHTGCNEEIWECGVLGFGDHDEAVAAVDVGMRPWSHETARSMHRRVVREVAEVTGLTAGDEVATGPGVSA